MTARHTIALHSPPPRLRQRRARGAAACAAAALGAATLLLAGGLLLAAGTVRAADVGGRAPAFTLRDRDGRSVALGDVAGQVVIVDFWASWCVPCAPMLPALDAIARRFQGTVRVLAIDVDQSRTKAQEFLREYLPAPSPWTAILEDADGDVLARYGAAGMPAVFVIDGGGTIRFADAGYSAERLRALEETLRALGARERAEAATPQTLPTPPPRRD